MRLWILIVLGASVLASLMAAASPSPGYGSGTVVLEPRGASDGGLSYGAVLVSLGKANFTFYVYNPTDQDLDVSIRFRGREVLHSRVPPGLKGIAGTLRLEGAGWGAAEVLVSTPRGDPRGVRVEVSSEGSPGLAWQVLLPVYFLVLAGPVSALVVRLSQAWGEDWAPGYTGLLIGAGLEYFLGEPGALALPLVGAGFHAYIWLALRAKPVRVIVVLLAFAIGAFSAYYTRSRAEAHADALLGRLGLGAILLRLAGGAIVASVGYISGMLSYALATGLLQALAGAGGAGPFLAFIARDALCIFILVSGIALLAAGLSLATGAPGMVMVVGSLFALTVLSPPCTLATGRFGARIVGGSVVERYSAEVWRLRAPAIESAMYGVAGLLIALWSWMRR